MTLAGIELETLVSESHALTTRPPQVIILFMSREILPNAFISHFQKTCAFFYFVFL